MENKQALLTILTNLNELILNTKFLPLEFEAAAQMAHFVQTMKADVEKDGADEQAPEADKT